MSIHVGQVESVTRTFSQRDFDRFAVLSGDDNPIHVDPAFSARTRFGATVAHGMLLYGAVCGVLGTRLPGPGTMQLEQELMFPSPTYAGEETIIRLEVTEVHPSQGLAELITLVVRPNENLGLQGRTLVQLPGKVRERTPRPRPAVPVPASAPSPSLKGLAVGQRAQTRRVFTMEDLDAYADLTADVNPVFTNPDYARRVGLDGPMVPGSLLGGMFSYLLGTELPGRGTNYLKQRLVFPTAAYPAEELTATVEITRLRPEKELVNLRTVCTNPAGDAVCRGEALVLVRDVEGR